MVPSALEVSQINARVEALKKSGLWSSNSLGFNDTDCDAYFQRAGVNNLTGRSEVLWFVRGLKSLDLYRNAVLWPMRSYQNAGTGTTVYSLGGLGRYDGTMVNSPTWSLSGMNNFVYNSKYISLSLFALDGFIPSACFSSYYRQSDSFILTGTVANSKLFVMGAGASAGIGAGVVGRGYSTLDALSPASVWYANTIEMSNSLKLGYKSINGAAPTSSGVSTINWSDYTSASTSYQIQGTGGDANDLLSIWIYFNKSVINSAQKLYTLYKNTMGSNISLP